MWPLSGCPIPTPGKEEKRERERERNKRHARESRARKKKRFDELEEMCRVLEARVRVHEIIQDDNITHKLTF